jgi:hypothetical protein
MALEFGQTRAQIPSQPGMPDGDAGSMNTTPRELSKAAPPARGGAGGKKSGTGFSDEQQRL